MTLPLRPVQRFARFVYGDSLAGDDRVDDGSVVVFGSNGPVGRHDRANTLAPAIIVGRKGSHGKLQWSDAPIFAIDTTYFIDPSALRPGVDLRWLYYALQTVPLDTLSTDVGVPGLSRDAAYQELIPDCPLEEQRVIADFLDRETTRIDKLIEKKQLLANLLQEKQRILALHMLRRLAKKNGEVPLKRMVQCLDGQRVPLSAEERADRKGEYAYHGASDIVDWVDDYLFDETLVLLGEDGAQLADPKVAVARVVEGKVWVNNHAHVLRPTAVDPHYLTVALNSFDRHAFISGATRPKITQGDMNQIPVPTANESEQRQFLRDYERVASAPSRIQVLLRGQLDKLREHRQALITSAVTGQLEVTKAA